MNPVMKLAVALLAGLEISFVASLSLNVGLIVASLFYLLLYRISGRTLLYFIAVPLIPAVGTMITQIMYGAGLSYGWILATRIYAYVLMGAVVAIRTSAIQMTNALTENCRLPTNLAFGVLSALNLLPQIIRQVKIIKIAGEMRGVHLTWMSPTLYFKAIIASIQWADQLSKAMIAHGFVENAPRTHYYRYPIKTADWIKLVSMLVIIQLLILI